MKSHRFALWLYWVLHPNIWIIAIGALVFTYVLGVGVCNNYLCGKDLLTTFMTGAKYMVICGVGLGIIFGFFFGWWIIWSNAKRRVGR